MFELIRGINAEIIGETPENRIYIGDAAELSEKLAKELAGCVSLIYMDPPFNTGKSFNMKLKLKDAESGLNREALIPAYSDKLDKNEYISYMRRVLASSKELLASDGLIFIHIDYRVHAYMRLLADEIFGEDNFINEIVWVYESGGRGQKSFSRKHDIILMYSRAREYDLHIDDVAVISRESKKNHMARGVDEDGRAYRTIKTGGKTYRYYDDEPVPPSDVWSDISHLQQRDPQRMGYATQKPLALLERIIKCASRPGDIVFDPFFGSGTTLEAAFKLGRRFIGIDKNPICADLAISRTVGAESLVSFPNSDGEPNLDAEVVPGITDTAIYLNSFELEPGLLPFVPDKLDAIAGWAVGTIEGDAFKCFAMEARTGKKPRLKGELKLPRDTANPIVRISDIFGRRFFFKT